MGQINPAEGERRAIAGYFPQYTCSAAIVLRALVKRKLEWIKVADPDAGRVDDFQLGTHNRVDAFQVKWSTHAATITWSDLTKDRQDKPSLIRQLADGWQRLHAQRSNCRVVVHLVTNDMPSVSDQLPVDADGTTQRHLSAFLAQAWNPWRKDTSTSISSLELPWRYTMEQLYSASGLSRADFQQFAADCEFDFGTRLPVVDSFSGREQASVLRDIEHIRSKIFETVWSPQKIVELSCDEILQVLGWTGHFLLRRKHEFPVEHDLYRPITDTTKFVNGAIDRLSGGYLAVLGSPGSGKSTLLTHLLRHRAERVVRYYAFVPSSGDPLPIRGESVSFLHDLVCQIAEAGVIGASSISTLLDRRALQEALNLQLQVLGDEYAGSGRKTIILVDGLDHVPREYHPDRSFLLDLPLPSQIPDGILFILGSQTDELEDLPREVRDSVRHPDRRIEVGKLSKSAVHEIMEQALPGRGLTDEQKESVFGLCDGHPLALRYLLNRLVDSTDIEQDLKEAQQYSGNITKNYHTYWSLLRDQEPQVAHMLALLCRMRAPIDMVWVTTWANDGVIRSLQQMAGHYFSRENEVRWSFFHNSFRIYVEYESARSGLEKYEKSRDQDYHRELAERFSKHATTARHRLGELYHRAMQGDCSTVLQLSRQSLFRNLAYAGIPIDRIIDGIHWALESAVQRQDALALIRLAFSLKEAHQRYEEQDEATVIDLLLGLGEYDSVIEHLRDGPRLVGAESTALRCSLELLNAGRTADARSLFDLAEPIDVLTKRVHTDQTSPFYDSEALGNWTTTAVHFRGTNTVLEIIAELKTEEPPDHLRISPEEFLADVRNQMRMEAGEELLYCHRWAEFRAVRDTLNPHADVDAPDWLRLTIDAVREAYRSGDADTTATELSKLVETVTPSQCDERTRTAIAECIYRAGGDADMAREWIAGLPQPSLVDHLYTQHMSDLSPWAQRIRLNSLLYALVENHPSPQDIVVDVPDQGKTGMVVFERALCQLARFRGRRWCGKPLARADVVHETLGLLRLFYRDWRHARNWRSWHDVQKARSAFYKELTTELSLHGLGCLEQLMAIMESEWAEPNNQYWPLDVKRAVVLEAVQHGMPKYWAVQHLDRLDDQVKDLDVNGRVGHYGEQGKAWLAVNEPDRARGCLERMRKSTVGVGYRKDYQSNVWIRRLREYLETRPDEAYRLITWMARAVVTLEDTTERAAFEAAQELVEVAFEQSPHNAIRLTRWFCERGLRWWHQAGLESIICSAAQSSLDSPDLLLAVSVDMFMPLATHVSSERVPEHLGDYVLNRLSSEEGLRILDDIVSTSDVLSLANTRQGWRDGLNGALRKRGLPERYQPSEPEEESGSGHTGAHGGAMPPASLKLKSGEHLSEEEVKRKSATFEGIIELLQQSTDEYYGYDWDSLVRQILSDLNRQQLVTLIEPLRAKGRTELLLEIGHRLNDFGDADNAKSLAEEVLTISYRLSTEWREEPSTTSAIALLRKIDRDHARKVAYKAIAREMTRHSFIGYEIVTRIPAVLKYLEAKLPPETLWQEIEEHLHTLFDDLDMAHIPSPDLDSPVEQNTPSQALVDLLMVHAVHPCNEVRLGAMRGLARAVKAGCAETVATIKHTLAGSESQQWHLIRLAEALSVEKPDTVQPWQSEITGLGASPNYAIRQMVRAICSRLGWSPSPAPQRSKLPTVYHLWIPDDTSGMPIIDGPATMGAVSPDTDNPAIMIRPFHLDAEMLAKMAGLESNAVFVRMAALMRDIEPFETWSADAEKRYLDELKRAGPEFPYNRPRAVVARRALFHVAAELADAGSLSETELGVFFQYTRPHDPSFLLRIGIPRPQQLVLPPEREYPKTVEEWKKEGKPGQCMTELEGLIVLAEDTHFKSLGDDHLKERRQSVVLPTDWVDETTDRKVDLLRRLHEVVIGGTVGNYLDFDNLPRDLVIANRLDGCDSPGSEWLATNPAMAQHFGWQYEGGRWFAWRNASGDTMMRSLWWQEGPLNHIAHTLHCWVSEGWMVLAAPEAIRRIEDEVGLLSRVSCITRAAGNDDRGHTGIGTAELATR